MLGFFRVLGVFMVLGVVFGFPAKPAQGHFPGRHTDCSPPQHVVLHFCHPCTGCTYDIPVCLPACCQGAPSVHFQRTIIGQGRAVFQWCCGHRVVVRFTRCGDFRIVTWW